MSLPHLPVAKKPDFRTTVIMRGSASYNLLNFKVLMMMSVAERIPSYFSINDLPIKVEHRVLL
jgi:hypothetical protein